MEVRTFDCDICGKRKSIHIDDWFVVFEREDASVAAFTTWAFNEPIQNAIINHICSQECLHVKFSRLIDAWTAKQQAPYQAK